VVTSQEEKAPYIALAFLSKYIILRQGEIISTFKLQLTCNIAEFDAGFVGVDGVNDGMQTYFVFATAKGQLMTVPVDNPENRVVINVEPGVTICSVCSKDSSAYLGTENGFVLKADMNSRKIVARYDSGSQLPIFNIRTIMAHLIFGTCQGELHIVDQHLSSGKVVSAHQAMVTLLLVVGSNVYSVGDDLVMRVWNLTKEVCLTETKNQFFSQKPNLLFTVSNSVFINFYEETSFFEV
jgi:hypothetical protein